MNITAKELSGMHVGQKIQLGTTYATITKVESDAQTVNIRAVEETSGLAPEMFFLSIPVALTVTIQDDEPIVHPRLRTWPGPINLGFQTINTPFIEAQTVEFMKVNRVELIRNGKREVVRYGEPGVKIYMQDDGRTLKIHFQEGQ